MFVKIFRYMNNQVGPPVEGEDFYGRDNELNFAWKHIQKGNSIILAAPRRVGKSSFAKKLLSKAKSEKWNTFEINLEEIKSEIGFVNLFVEKLQNESWWQKPVEKLEQILSSLKPTIKYEEIEAKLEWQSKKADVYEKLKQLLNHQSDTLIMIDEVTILLNSFLEDDEKGIENVKFFLNWLRSFRQITGTKIRWVFCSSIGIDNFTNQHGLSYTFNDVNSFPLGAFNETTSIGLLKALAQSDELSTNELIIKAMLNKIGWLLPYFLQILHYKLNYLVSVDGDTLNEQTLDKAYKLLIEEKHLNTWEERLKDYGLLEADARLVLTHICKSAKGISRNSLVALLHKKYNDPAKAEEIVGKLLYMLKNDGYLVEEEGKYFFRSPLLRDFWFNRTTK
jgi:uncharacterized protein